MQTITITREELRDAVFDVMVNGDFADAVKDKSPIMLLAVPVIGFELEKKLFSEETNNG